MTTIAFDGVTMASDSRITGSFLLQNKEFKKVRRFKSPNGNYVVGCCGDCSEIERFFSWFRQFVDGDAESLYDREEEVEAIIYCEDDGELKLHTGQPHAFNVGFPIAIGSGSMAAMAAMYCGRSAKDAIVVASMLDTSTDDEVVAIKVKKVVDKRKKTK